MPKTKTTGVDETIDTQNDSTEIASVQESKTPKTKSDTTPKTKSEIMKEALAKQPKVSIYIPLEKGESKNAVETVILNGYRLNIKKGVYVEVPKQVADIIKDSYQQTLNAQENALKNVPESERLVLDNSNS